MKRIRVCVSCVAVFVGCLHATTAAPLRNGDILVVDPVLGNVLSIDQDTGYRRLVSGAGVGEGPLLVQPTQLAYDPDGDIYVVDKGSRSVIKVDAASGDRTVLASEPVNSTDGLWRPFSIELRNDGLLIVSDHKYGRIVRVDTETGRRGTHAQLGYGDNPWDLVFTPDGDILYPDSFHNEIRMVPSYKNGRGILYGKPEWTTVVDNSSPDPADATMLSPSMLAIEPSGDIFATTKSYREAGTKSYREAGIVRWNAETGLKSVVSSRDVGVGPEFIHPAHMGLAPDGALYLTDYLDGLFRINVATGDRVIVSGVAVGGGAGFEQMQGMTVVVPEPSCLLILMGVCSLGLVCRSPRSG